MRTRLRCAAALLVIVARRTGRVGIAGARRSAGVSRSAAVGVLRLAAAIITGLGNGAQVAGVAVGTWAAWEIAPTAGRVVLAVGLLFLGGAIARVVREVRNGTR